MIVITPLFVATENTLTDDLCTVSEVLSCRLKRHKNKLTYKIVKFMDSEIQGFCSLLDWRPMLLCVGDGERADVVTGLGTDS